MNHPSFAQNPWKKEDLEELINNLVVNYQPEDPIYQCAEKLVIELPNFGS